VRRRLATEAGFTQVELLVTMVLTAIVMVGFVNIFVSGTRGGVDANARLDAQQNTRLALDRIEFEGRCATSATLVGGGQGVAFSLPASCSHATGNVTWCVVSGVLTRYTRSGCAGSWQPFVSGVRSAQPFMLPATPTGDLPQLAVALTVDTSAHDVGTSVTVTDLITLRNAARAS
jgi:Tfp pilus assembly protein PilW